MPEQNSTKPTPYNGSDPYIFISFSHKDIDEAMSIIARMQSDGYRVWYDEGLSGGSVWNQTIASHIENCACFITLISQNYQNSKYCSDEVVLARDYKKPVLLIYIEDVHLTLGLQMLLHNMESIHKHKYSDMNEFFVILNKTEIINCCHAAASGQY